MYNEENSMLETAFKSSVDVAKAKMTDSGVQLNVVSKIVPLYDSFETQHHGKLDVILYYFTGDNNVLHSCSKYAKCSLTACPACLARPPGTQLPSCNRFVTTRKSLTYRPGGI